MPRPATKLRERGEGGAWSEGDQRSKRKAGKGAIERTPTALARKNNTKMKCV